MLRTAIQWGLGGAGAWLLLALGGPLLLGPGGHPPASALLLPALALPSILFRLGAGFGLPWLAGASIFVAAPLEWALLAAALGLVIRGGGASPAAGSPSAPAAFHPRALGLGVWVFYAVSFVAPLLLIRLPTIARWAVHSEGSAVRTGAVETLARSGGPGDVPLLTAVLEHNDGIYRQIRGAACGTTRWGGVDAWRQWAATPGGAQGLPGVVWVVVDVLANPAACPGPPIESSSEERDRLRLELAQRVVAGGLEAADAGERYRAIELIHAQIAPADREPYLPVLLETLSDSFWIPRAGALRLLLEIREERPIPDPVPWGALGEVDPQSATAAEVEESRVRWSRWHELRRPRPGTSQDPEPVTRRSPER